jgi:non-lysosomal glucosylceramidase
MKRRDFIAKTSFGAALAGSMLTTSESKATEIENKETQKPTDGLAVKDNGPVKEVMKYTDKPRSGIMVGSIGAGGAELRKDGIFYNWSIFNNNPKSSGQFLMSKDLFDSRSNGSNLYPIEPGYLLFFIVRYQVEGEEPKLKLLQIDQGYQVAAIGMHVYEYPWMTGIEQIEYSARFPYTNLKFSDSEMPLDIELEAHSPFIPHDVKNSSLPIMNFDFKIKSKSSKPVDVMILGSFRHLVGYDTMEKYYINDINKTTGYVENIATCGDMDTKLSSYGTVSFASLNADSTYYVGWENRHPYYEYVLRNKSLPNINDTDGVDSILKEHSAVPAWMPETKGRNHIDEKTGKKRGSNKVFNSLAYSKKLNSGEAFSHSFAMSWNFPNNLDEKKLINVGHYYQNFFKDSKEAMAYYVANKTNLSQQSKTFLTNFYNSSLPQFVLDQVNSQLNTFVTSGVLSKKMEFGVMEGITEHQNWGPIGTTDVNMYGGVMVSSLFPDLAKSTMKVHKLLQHEAGEIRHSFEKGFADAMMLAVNSTGYVVSERLDLHAQYTVMVLRDFFWTNDKAYLQEMWPSIKKAMEYVLRERDKNGDQQPDMTGIMSSYDNFPMYGMAAYIQSQWLCALASCVEAAKVLGDTASEKKYKGIFDKGKKLAEEKLWNGKYYRLYNSDLKVYKIKDGAGKEITKDISGIDEGCLTDQIIGQWAARWSGLGDILEPAHVKTAMKSILEKSYTPSFGLRNCSWPGSKFVNDVAKDIWVDQGNTCWSGVELAFASFLIYEGMYNESLQVIKTVDDRYRKAGRYFDHQEFGGHYFRSMSAWGIVNAMLGLSVNQEVYSFAPKFPEKNFKLFFSFATGTANIEASNGKVNINILSGMWNVKKINLADFNIASKSVKVTQGGKQLATAAVATGKATLDFKKTITIKTGESLVIA